MKTDTFNVVGEGSVVVKPDIATIVVGVQANGATVKQAQDQMNTIINQVSQDIKKLGVDGKDIQTNSYNIYPSYDYKNGPTRITGYQANTNLTVKIRNIDKANEIIDSATQAGANQVSSIAFDVEDKEKAQNEARQKAVDQAKKKAQDAAKIAGFSLGKLINYSENFGDNIRPLSMGLAKGGGPADAVNATQIESGSSEVKVTVTLTYDIK